ncbi:antibiotic biosynthesis monooxygenase family protein [Scytonema sp. NUACC26]|uniref:antibiotic biosynthesis monooxygenase family protein n=1 Tax=Scytonema sp. NUACC26 TaxID=3140176 RepID=UPI0034DCC4D8
MTVPVVLINLFSVPQGKEEEFAKMWTEALEFIKNEPGFIDANLHRSLDPNAQFQFINVAHWENQESWHSAFAKLQPQELTKQVPFEQIPALYEVAVHFQRE